MLNCLHLELRTTAQFYFIYLAGSDTQTVTEYRRSLAICHVPLLRTDPVPQDARGGGGEYVVLVVSYNFISHNPSNR
jgi:hypothetical protein